MVVKGAMNKTNTYRRRDGGRSRGSAASAGRRGRPWARAGLLASLLLLAASLSFQPGRAQTTAPATAPAVTQPATAPNGGPWGDYPLPDRPARTVPLPPLPPEVTKAFIIPIRETIDRDMAAAIKRKVTQVIASGGQLVIFDINTPGGVGGPMLEIIELITRDLKNARTVAFVNNEAVSAGAIISLSADEIAFARDATMGAAAVVGAGGQDIQTTMKQKVDSYVRSKVRNMAEAHGYFIPLCEAMIDPALEVWWVRNLRTGQTRYVNRDQWVTQVRALPAKAEVLRPDAEWDVVRVLVPADDLLSVTTSEAERYGFAAVVVEDIDALLAHYNVTAPAQRLEDTTLERVVNVMTSPVVSSILVMLILFFGYIEINTPGFGLPGALALVCLVVLFGSRYLVGLAQVWEIAIFVLGLILLAAELFITPGFGVLGISGILLCLVGLGAILIPNAPNEVPWPKAGLALELFLNGLFAVCTGGILGAVAIAVAAKYLPRMPVARKLVLAEVELTSEDRPSSATAAIRQIEPGATGRVEVLCRPVGRARFGDELVDVIAEGEFLPAGAEVEVIRNEGNRLLVRAAHKQA